MSNLAMELPPLGPLARPCAGAAHRARYTDGAYLGFLLGLVRAAPRVRATRAQRADSDERRVEAPVFSVCLGDRR
jgi:hypothetical protein